MGGAWASLGGVVGGGPCSSEGAWPALPSLKLNAENLFNRFGERPAIENRSRWAESEGRMQMRASQAEDADLARTENLSEPFGERPTNEIRAKGSCGDRPSPDARSEIRKRPFRKLVTAVWSIGGIGRLKWTGNFPHSVLLCRKLNGGTRKKANECASSQSGQIGCKVESQEPSPMAASARR